MPIGRPERADVKLRFWGVRGSFAMSGRDFLRYGGNTTSVELVTDAGRAPARRSRHRRDRAREAADERREFGKGEGKLPILLTHTHLDHIQGLPFFTPFFIKGNEIRIMGADPIAGCRSRRRCRTSSRRTTRPLNGLENLAAGVSIESFVPGATLDAARLRGRDRGGAARQHVDDRRSASPPTARS